MSEPDAIQIIVNGQPATTRAGILVPEFLRSRNLQPGRVVVEWNGKAQTRAESATIALSDGDVLEVVRIVAGG